MEHLSCQRKDSWRARPMCPRRLLWPWDGPVCTAGAELESIAITLNTEQAQSIALEVDEKRDLVLILRYDDQFEEPAPGDVTWASQDPNIAKVDDDGRIEGEGIGATRITALYRDFETSLDVTVTGVPQSLSLLSESKNVPTGLTLELEAELKFEHGEKIDVTDQVEWSSTVPEVATIAASGVATGIAPGNTVISASGFDLAATKNLEVKEAVALTIEASPTALTLQEGQTADLVATGTFSDGNVVDITSQARWESSNEAVAVARSNGRVEALAPGQVTVSAQKDGATALVSVEITALPPSQ